MTPPTWAELANEMRENRRENRESFDQVFSRMNSMAERIATLETTVKGRNSAATAPPRSGIDWGRIGTELLSWSIKGAVVIVGGAVFFAMKNGWNPFS